ncbi:uncharacterized protein LOC142896605 isoform X2 [Nelusetta ayraudi]|uniref:uncharacterized protein LOC142896605 isoform X2 n=1 Tax=Nelusetta ayraudi TaxID=303726 RepID=UPI003F6F0388
MLQLEERYEARKHILDDILSESQLEPSGIEVGRNKLLQWQLRESKHLTEKLSQDVSDLTAVLYLKEAELQYWQSRVSQHHREALTLAKDRNALRANLTDSEFTIECHLKQLAALHAEQKELKGALAQVAGKEAKRTPTTMDGGEDEGKEF